MNICNLLGLRMAWRADTPHVTYCVLSTVGRFVEIRMQSALRYAICLNVLIQFIY